MLIHCFYRSKALELKMVTPLLEQKMSNGATPLLEAVACGSMKTAQVLIESGADLTATNQIGENVVHLTADCGAVDLFKVCEIALCVSLSCCILYTKQVYMGLICTTGHTLDKYCTRECLAYYCFLCFEVHVLTLIV